MTGFEQLTGQLIDNTIKYEPTSTQVKIEKNKISIQRSTDCNQNVDINVINGNTLRKTKLHMIDEFSRKNATISLLSNEPIEKTTLLVSGRSPECYDCLLRFMEQ